MKLFPRIPALRAATFALVLVGGLSLSLSGCGQGGSLLANHTPVVTVTAGHSTQPLPSTIPLPARSVLIQEYSATINSASGTGWFYTVAGSSETPATVIDFYETNLPAQGWTAVAIPSETAQGKYGGTALAYQQAGQTMTVVAGVDSNYPRTVALIITVSGIAA